MMKFENIADLLKASPFDSAHDLYPNPLTPEVFYEHLHVRSPQTSKLLDDFDRKMFSGYEPRRVMFVKGFAGNGKTTFLQTFIRDHSAYRHVYCDLQKLRSTQVATPSDGESAADNDEIKLLMNRYLRKLPGIDETFRFIYANHQDLKDEDFISSDLHQHLAKAGPGVDSAIYIRNWMGQFIFKDIFTSLFIHLFRQPDQDAPTIVYFDNLDIPRAEYVADRFLVYFQDALYCAREVSRHALFRDAAIDFHNRYRFVICMREVNEAILNAHIGDHGFPRSSFPLAFDAESFRTIAEKRITYMETHAPDRNRIPNGQGCWSSLLGSILSDKYYRFVFLPLYNYNYRELAGALIKAIEDYQISEADTGDAYALRGILMFGLLKNLIATDFLESYRKTRKDPNGYCFVDRVMLTVLINASNYRRRIDDGEEGDDSDPYGLFYLVKDLQGLYNINSILTSIARCFLSYRLSRIHLLTVLNTKIDDAEEFVRNYTQRIQAAEQDDDHVGTINARNEIRSVLLKVNPAGFTCIRYILPHFEFYGALVHNTSALYRDPLEKVAKPNGHIYAFEEKIDNVFGKVEDHVKSMKRFFDRSYTSLPHMSAELFPTSNYCFRHEGMARVARIRGHSHTIKIVTAHRDYLDRFRVGLINRPELDEQTWQRINELLVTRIKKYVNLLRRAPDSAAGEEFARSGERCIKIIEASDYKDRTTRIYFADELLHES